MYLDQTENIKEDHKKECTIECGYEKCFNYEICKVIAHKCILQWHDGVCMKCDMRWGNWERNEDQESIIITSTTGNKLVFRDQIRCVICENYKERGIKIPLGSDSICFDCFERNFFTIEMEGWTETETESEEFYSNEESDEEMEESLEESLEEK